MPGPLLWDVFCRVIDNLGDVGVCWRLAADLAARGERVRLWLDDASALAWMAPGGAAGVTLLDWAAAGCAAGCAAEAGDVVVEAFGCDPPAAFVARMAARTPAPRWINLEYLSAEGYVERSHRLPSPQRNGLVKHFFYPGFTAATGGLLREPGLMARQAGFDRAAWLAAHGGAPHAGELVALLFAYPQAPVAALAEALAAQGRGAAVRLLRAPGAPAPRPLPGLRDVALPWLPQPVFDEALWSADLLFVRGEDSFVRAQWAGRPFVWQIYPQHDGAHRAKLEAFLDRHLEGAAPALAAALRAWWRGWNGFGPLPQRLPLLDAWAAHAGRWRDRLLAQDDLVTQLRGFVGAGG